jgi:hypothetical protein
MKKKAENCDVQKDEQYFRLRAFCHTVYVALSVRPWVDSRNWLSHRGKKLRRVDELVLNAF